MLRTHPGQINDLIELMENIEGADLTLVEVGSYMGESMEIFAKSNKFKRIYCIDPWLDTDSTTEGVSTSETHFDKRKQKYDFVTKIKKTSFEASMDFEDSSIDIVYIDAEHTPEAVRKDIKNWLPKIKSNGYITGHDWEFRNGVLQNSIIETIGVPDYICKHVIRGGKSDGSWLKNKKNITL
jgi:hypothetical protein